MVRSWMGGSIGGWMDVGCMNDGHLCRRIGGWTDDGWMLDAARWLGGYVSVCVYS